MGQTLRLEYACTKEELTQAQSLSLRKQLGEGSQWRSTLVLLVILVGMVLGFYVRVQKDVSPAYRPLVYGLAIAASGAAYYVIQKRKARGAAAATNTVEISDKEITILGAGSNFTLPWTAFSDCLESPELFVLVDRPKQVLLVFPKRAFPSENWVTWFREQTENRWRLPDPQDMEPLAIPASPSADCIKLRIRLGFRDYVDRTIASSVTWGFLLFMTTIFVVAGVAAAANPPPRPIYSAAQVFFMFMLPFLLVMMLVVIVLGSLKSWFTHRRYSVPQDVELSEETIAFSGALGKGSLPWTTYTRYKETRWSFILWNHGTSVWTMIPKRVLTLDDDLRRCRVLLERRLARSRWFFG